jgi:hypothetical protein
MLGANRLVRQLGERVRGAEARGEKTNTNLLISRRLRRKLPFRQLGGRFSRRENFYEILLRNFAFWSVERERENFYEIWKKIEIWSVKECSRRRRKFLRNKDGREGREGVTLFSAAHQEGWV